MTLSTLKKEDFTFATVSRAMLNEEQRRITSDSLPTSNNGIQPQSAMTASSQSRKPCTWCGLDNHLEASCHRKKNGSPQRYVADRKQALDEFYQRGHQQPHTKSKRNSQSERNTRSERDTANYSQSSDEGKERAS